MFTVENAVHNILMGIEIENLKEVTYEEEIQKKIVHKFIDDLIDIEEGIKNNKMSHDKAFKKLSRSIKNTIYKLIHIHEKEICEMLASAGYNIIHITDLEKDIDYIGDVVRSGSGNKIISTYPTIVAKYIDDEDEVETIVAAGITVIG